MGFIMDYASLMADICVTEHTRKQLTTGRTRRRYKSVAFSISSPKRSDTPNQFFHIPCQCRRTEARQKIKYGQRIAHCVVFCDCMNRFRHYLENSAYIPRALIEKFVNTRTLGLESLVGD